MRKALLLFFLSILCTQVFGQFISNIDSAKRVMQSSKEDTAKANLLHRIVLSYTVSNKDSALLYATQEYELAQKLNYPKGLANAYHGIPKTSLTKFISLSSLPNPQDKKPV